MAESHGVTRMNISVPGDLKRDMDAVTAAVNWSAVATEAFRAKLLELRATQKGISMNDVIERLKAAAKLEANASTQAGHKEGEAWAKNEAKPKELKRLAEAIEVQGSAEDLVGGHHNHLGHPGTIAAVITGRDDLDSQDCQIFWSGVVEETDSIDDADFAIGFVTGAVEVWEAVKDHI